VKCADDCCRDCTVQDASGGVIVTEGSFAMIDKCYFKNSHMIGLLHCTSLRRTHSMSDT